MEMFGNIRCVTRQELVMGDNPILSKSNYDNYVKRGKIKIVRRGGICQA